MKLAGIQQSIASFSLTRNLISFLHSADGKMNIPLPAGSSLSFIARHLFTRSDKHILLILRDKEKAAYVLNDLEGLIPAGNLLFFPASHRRPYEGEDTDNANILLRTEVLQRLASAQKPALIITYPEALFEKVVNKSELMRQSLRIHTGEEMITDDLVERIFEMGFEKTGYVTQPGEFSLRGGIIDIFSFSFDLPYRMEFEGDRVASIRTFNPETQLSTGEVKQLLITPGTQNYKIQSDKIGFPQFTGKKTLIWIEDKDTTAGTLRYLYRQAVETFTSHEKNSPVAFTPPGKLYYRHEDFEKDLTRVKHIISQPGISPQKDFQSRQQPVFDKNLELLFDDLRQKTEENYQIYLFCDNDKQASRIEAILSEQSGIRYSVITYPLYRGFVLPSVTLACYTDHQIFGRYHRFRLKKGYKKSQSLSLQELTGLQKGDYVVHIDHGIGIFGGLQKIEVNGKLQEAVKLIYAGTDVLYLNIHSLHKIAKYNGKDGKRPKIYKLGSGAWKKLKQKTKARVKKMAFDLLELYAKRMYKKGFAFAPDSWLQNELEASFIYEDTPDQLKATEEVKKDMESPHPMDRLICGDVGFGKTEIAIRAAFKAVDNGKQVAVLVPTTLLAFQHYRNFSDRLNHFPVRVEYLSRHRTAKEQKGILKDLSERKIDILIGTHKLVSPTVKFKDLGLLIVDEEQKFGVNIKDKLKNIRVEIDTLTLTATPIPRTLQFSLMAVRNLSLINTPPPNRYPVETRVIQFQPEQIRDAILYEITRNGQVFFIHNRVENIREVAGMLQKLLPDVKIGIGHGKMDGKKLEQLMMAFIDGEFDVLVSTTIIESGLDVPNANTIFINNAHHFGLSDLHQIRGRVGRSNKKAFCYMLTPPMSAMNAEAQKRMRAIQTYTELGSGFQIAMKDLEIRGAGDLLGAEQSGFINDLGFDTYQKILKEAVTELQEKEFKELYRETEENPPVSGTVFETDMELLIPDDYIPDTGERLKIYQRISTMNQPGEITGLENELRDRFGPLPEQVHGLLDGIRIKLLAAQLGWEKAVLKKNSLLGYLPPSTHDTYYQSEVFKKILDYAGKHPSHCRIKERKTASGDKRLLLRWDYIQDRKTALGILEEISGGIT